MAFLRGSRRCCRHDRLMNADVTNELRVKTHWSKEKTKTEKKYHLKQQNTCITTQVTLLTRLGNCIPETKNFEYLRETINVKREKEIIKTRT